MSEQDKGSDVPKRRSTRQPSGQDAGRVRPAGETPKHDTGASQRLAGGARSQPKPNRERDRTPLNERSGGGVNGNHSQNPSASKPVTPQAPSGKGSESTKSGKNENKESKERKGSGVNGVKGSSGKASAATGGSGNTPTKGSAAKPDTAAKSGGLPVPKNAAKQIGDKLGGAGKGTPPMGVGAAGKSGTVGASNADVAKNNGPQKNGQDGADGSAKANGNEQTDKKDGGSNKNAAAGGTAAAAAGAAKNEAKAGARGANATGVDYSDKSLKDQLEHQAADVAMDATPFLGQVNSARKALKEVNKKKREATGPKEDDILDKTEQGADKAVSGGIKAVKYGVAGAAAGGAGMTVGSMILMAKLITMIKGLLTGVLGKVAGFFGGIVSSAGSFVSGALGIGLAAGKAVASGIMSGVLVIGGSLGVGAISDLNNKDPGDLACLPDQKQVSAASQEYVNEGGDAALMREENAGKLWSVYSAIGGSKEQTAAVLGNLHHESSGLDPTATETIYSEPFQMGPRKMDALAKDYKVDLIDAAYGAKFPAIDYIGIGLAQWTNDRNRLLIDYAKKQDANWYDFDTQIGFMLAGDQPYRQQQLKDFLSSTPGNIDVETERFMNTWIGLSSPNNSLGHRKEAAIDYMFMLERATADTEYAEGILSGLNIDRSSGNASAGAYQHDDGCGNPIATHYAGNVAEDGTGEVPPGLTLVPWSRETLPESLKQYAKNPEDAGLRWGSATGWATGIIANQCVALATSYFMQLYPDWNKDGRAGTRPFGHGKTTAPGWANHYGQKTVSTPSSGAVFSDGTTSVYGHTGIVQHVFANGDILINEQNVAGISGEGAGLNYSWGWRVIKKERYQQSGYQFFKPEGAVPQWSKGSSM